MSIKYSVLVPVYNVEEYISECIESVLHQTYTNFELVLVDDGSPDKSGRICDDYAKLDSRIKVFHKENHGLIHTRRYAIEKASGDYYVFLDSDDKIKQDALETINRKILEYNCDCIIYGFERVLDGKTVSKVYDPIEKLLCKKEEIYHIVFFSTDYNSMCRKAVKASVFHEIDYSPFYHLKYSEDLLQSLEIYKYSKTIVFIPDVLYEYRMNMGSITHGSERMLVDYTIRENVFKYLKDEPELSEEILNKYKDFCINMVIGDIIKFAISHMSYDQIEQKIKEIRTSSYYQVYLSKGISDRRAIGIRSLVFDMFQRRMDILMVYLIKIGHYIKKTIH